MKKFKTNPKEDLAEGLVIGDGIGMRLRVMDYWACAETGVFNPSSTGMDESSLKIVIAESLPDQGKKKRRSCINQTITLKILKITDGVMIYLLQKTPISQPS